MPVRRAGARRLTLECVARRVRRQHEPSHLGCHLQPPRIPLVPDGAAIRRLSACFDGHRRLRRDHHRHAGSHPEACGSAAGSRQAVAERHRHLRRGRFDRHPQRQAGDRRAHDSVPRGPATTGDPLRARTWPVAGSPSPPGVPDGTLAARIVAEDAAGNPVVAQRTHQASTGPHRSPCSSVQAGTSIVISVTDASSGVAGTSTRGSEQVDGGATGLSAPTLENGLVIRHARPRPRLARRHAGNRARRGGQRRAGRPHASHDHERECRAAQPQGPFRPREGPLRPRRDGSSAGSRSPRAKPSRVRRSSRRRPSVVAVRAAACGHRDHRPPRPLLAASPRRPESHLSPRLQRRRRRPRRRPRRVGARAGLEHDPRIAHAAYPAGRGCASAAAFGPEASRSPAVASCSSCKAASAGAGAPSRTPGRTATAAGGRATRSAAALGGIRSASASGASRATRSSSATRER